jgi:hypothetical protein
LHSKEKKKKRRRKNAAQHFGHITTITRRGIQ